MVYRSQNKNEIILVCSNKNCDFQSQPIKLDQSYTKLEEITEEKNEQKPIEVQNYEIRSESFGSQTILQRTGKINEFIIYCIDFSTRMDIEIPIDDKLVKNWKEKIEQELLLSDPLKNELIELINPPLSIFHAILFIFSIFLLDNVKKMTFEDFKGFQIISFAGNSDEIFRFPSSNEDTTTDIIINFIKIMNITRQEYRSSGELTYRNFGLAIQNVSDLVTELRESYPLENINIFLLTIGNHKTKENKYLNPIREIKEKLEDLNPYSFNLINLNGLSLENSLGQIPRRFSGIYSRENTFKGLLNSILYHQYGTNPYQKLSRIQDLNGGKQIKKEPEKIKILGEGENQEEFEDIEVIIQENDINLTNIKISDKKNEEFIENLPEITITRMADKDLDNLIKDLK